MKYNEHSIYCTTKGITEQLKVTKWERTSANESVECQNLQDYLLYLILYINIRKPFILYLLSVCQPSAIC